MLAVTSMTGVLTCTACSAAGASGACFEAQPPSAMPMHPSAIATLPLVMLEPPSRDAGAATAPRRAAFYSDRAGMLKGSGLKNPTILSIAGRAAGRNSICA